ncbi:GNAT family N-acetyltransferase [Paenibacillus massiliensis]|uniref:GNAT family N-acetyltransferase n=1 Tax=Paenibacillus massiliensis TaxID=225917 RepID=UPI00041C3891|nr:GNAT family N-acetyltransferase [Paenibacillus massiliensis]
MYSKKANSSDYELILQLWERSVRATHDFLQPGDLKEIRKEIPSYLPLLDVQLWYTDDHLVGFSSVHEQHLEMLFLDSDALGMGYGTQIIQRLIHGGVTSVDVNKDNPRATSFYLKHGFRIISESPTDSAGRAYPILHLSRFVSDITAIL